MAQEQEAIKANEVDAPTLFVGVGGKGCQIVVRVAEMCKPSETDNINFVCLDTNVNDLKDASNSKSHIYVVQTSNTQTVGNYLFYDKDAEKNWFPNNAVLYGKTVSEGAGQVRAVSRLAFNSAMKLGKLKPLTDAIDDLFKKDGKAFKQAMRVVFATTASGGTGSGLVLPLAMYVRSYIKDKYPNTAAIIRSLILLPETLASVVKESSPETKSQRRNAYATIKEINAFMMLGSGFFDIDEDLKKFSDLHVDYTVPGSDEMKRLALLPFDFCFLMDGQNSEDQTLGSIEQYVEQAAMSLYEQNIGPMQRSAFSIEDNIIKELADGKNYGRNRFGGLGASILRYPYDDIVDYIAYQWAINSICGAGDSDDRNEEEIEATEEEAVGRWLKYDNRYKEKRAELEKSGGASSDLLRGTVYTDFLKSQDDAFSRDLKSRFLGGKGNGDDVRINAYFTDLENYVQQAVNSNSGISHAESDAKVVKTKNIDYSGSKGVDLANDHVGYLREYENQVKRNVKNIAENIAETIFYNDKKTINVRDEKYMLEYLLHNGAGNICHPNAMRYYLYKVKAKMDEKRNDAEKNLSDAEAKLVRFSEDENDPNFFNLESTKNEEEANIDDVANAVGTGKQGKEKTESLNKKLPEHYNEIKKYAKAQADYSVYLIGAQYVGSLCEAFEKFYDTFIKRTNGLKRMQRDIEEALTFKEGDSLKNVCATPEMLKSLCKATESGCNQDRMLDDEVNGEIFDAMKANVEYDRESRYMDIVEGKHRIDVFGEVLVEHYKKQVREQCKAEIDLNIIEALARECEFMRSLSAGTKEERETTHEDKVSYIKAAIEEGVRLAAPSIERLRNESPREINLVAYNSSLLDMYNYDVKTEFFPEGTAAESISKYELHFYNALYNLTPDQLNKFACYRKTGTGERPAGLYHEAYVEYEKGIGPDSTKCHSITTHIDKRWDSVAVMPEIDFDYQDQCVMKIHQAMIYGLVLQVIKKRPVNGQESKEYMYEDSDERIKKLDVSNKTNCNEFYEILDALYLSPEIVEDIEKTERKRREVNEVRQSRYENTDFKTALKEFTIEDSHPGETSLFEIPLIYYNSLPNSLRYEADISAMVDATIQVFKDECNRWEPEQEAYFQLCKELDSQFNLLIDNFNMRDKTDPTKYDKAYSKLRNKKTVETHEVLDIIFRKIRRVYESSPSPEDYQRTIATMKKRLQDEPPQEETSTRK